MAKKGNQSEVGNIRGGPKAEHSASAFLVAWPKVWLKFRFPKSMYEKSLKIFDYFL